MKLDTYKNLKNKMDDFVLSDYQVTICRNMKKFRKELYEEFKIKYPNTKNPYTTLGISELLGISHEYYKRIESYDKNKPISIKLFLKMVVLLDKNISEFLK